MGEEASSSAPASSGSSSSGGNSTSSFPSQLQLAQQAWDQGLKSVAGVLGTSIALALQQAKEAKAVGCALYKEGTAYVDSGLAQARALEQDALRNIKQQILAVAALPPYVSYPVVGFSALMIMPWTRRALYNATIGRLRTPESIARASQGRVEGLKGKLDEVSTESQKLAERMRAAEEEMRRGMSALRDTRIAMQRLASTAAKSEKTAYSVLQDLRRIKALEGTSQLRAEAASQLAAFKSHHSQLSKYVRRIVNQDV